MKLIIEDDEGHKTTVPFVREEITVGRQDGNTIRLTERNVSRKHARFFRKSGGIYVEDLSSHNGIKVNGDRIEAAIALKEGDLVQIGDYDLAVQDENANNAGTNRATVKMDALPDIPGDSSDNDSGATSRDLRKQAGAAPAADPAEPDEVERDPSKPAAPARGAQATAVIRMNGAEEHPAAAAAIPPAPPAVDIAPHDGPRLVMVSTELAGREFACLRSVLTIGRGDECDIPIDHRSLSREHARLERQKNGQWRVVDLGSANKLQVNGEEYAESAVSSGDVITLGHVKLRFIGPGEEYTYVPEGSTTKRSPAVFIAAGVGAVAVIGIGVYFGVIRKPAPSDAPSLDNPKTTVQPSLVPKVDDHAVAAPDSAKGPTGSTAAEPPKVEAVVAMADPKSAKAAVPESAKTPEPAPKAATPDEVVVPDHAAAPEPKATVPPPDLKAPPPPHHDEPKHVERTPPPSHTKPDPHAKAAPEPAAAAPTPKDEANKLLADASDLMRQGQYDGAISKLRQALKLNPNDAQLHKVLGGCLANSGEMDQAAKEYRRFVELAPNSPDVPKVRQMLDAYDKSKQ